MILVTFFIAGLFEIALPIVLAVVLARRYGASWKLFGVGVLTFIGSQIVHMPLVYGLTALFQSGGATLPEFIPAILFSATVLGLLAGLCEEPARWVGYRLLKERGNAWRAALMLGAGHGGIESIFIGFSVLSQAIVMLVYGAQAAGLSAEAQSSIASLWALPWHLPLVGAVERLVTVLLHVTLSVMVWLCVSRRQWLWLAGAVLWHALVDFVAVYASRSGLNIWALEGIIALTIIPNLIFLYWVWRKTQETLPAAGPLEEGENAG